MKHRNPKKLAQRIVGIILLTGGNLIATTLYLPEFRYVPELFGAIADVSCNRTCAWYYRCHYLCEIF